MAAALSALRLNPLELDTMGRLHLCAAGGPSYGCSSDRNDGAYTSRPAGTEARPLRHLRRTGSKRLARPPGWATAAIIPA